MKTNQKSPVISLLVLIALLFTLVPAPLLLAQETQGSGQSAQQGGSSASSTTSSSGSTRTSTTSWYADPVWIAVGVVVLILLIVLIATASRGNRTTVIKS
jgi:hypothetical protein